MAVFENNIATFTTTDQERGHGRLDLACAGNVAAAPCAATGIGWNARIASGAMHGLTLSRQRDVPDGVAGAERRVAGRAHQVRLRRVEGFALRRADVHLAGTERLRLTPTPRHAPWPLR